jgi:DNA-binding response OmpR family regulator
VSLRPFRRGPLRLAPARGEAWLDNHPLSLTPLPYAILYALARAYPTTVYSVALERLLWPEGAPVSPALQVHVGRLRAALGSEGVAIRSVYGVGYRLVVENKATRE